MFPILILGAVTIVCAHYCETPECPGFSLLKSLKVEDVTNEFIEIIWEPKKDYTIDQYEVLWFTDSGCLQCNGKLTLTNTSVRLRVKPCTLYTIEVYASEDNATVTAPLILKQITAPTSLINGTTVRLGPKWALVRWLKKCDCPNSTHIAGCFGPNYPVKLKPSYPDNVVLFNFSTLSENSEYICSAYTLNSAGSSPPSKPVLFKTGEDIIEHGSMDREFLFIPLIIVASISTVVVIYFLNKNGIIEISWRRSYVVNGTDIYEL